MVYLNSIIAIGTLMVLTASAMTWMVAFKRLSSGQPLLEYEPRRPVPWGFVDLGIAFLLLIMTQVIAAMILRHFNEIELGNKLGNLSPDDLAATLLANLLASLAALLLTLIAVILRSGAKWSDVGFDFRFARRDAWTALLAFLMLAPSVYLIQLVVKTLQALLTKDPVSHPLIESVMNNPSLRFFLITGLSAVVMAPLVEEFLFRVLLQGWLERVASHRGEAATLLLGGIEEPHDEKQFADKTSGKPAIDESSENVPSVLSDDNPYATPRSLKPAEEHPAAKNDRQRRPPFWPILVSALLFAGMHYSNGPDPIPLFVLAVGLGYLYQRTHRILPCILVHFMLNACSMGILWIMILFK